MARNDSDNYYRRQQEEANRIATKQHRALTDIARHAKSQAEELRKLRRAFEDFAEAILNTKVQPFQVDAAPGDAAKLEMTSGDIPPKEAAANAMRAIGWPDKQEPATEPNPGVHAHFEQPRPKVDIAPKGKPKTRITRLGYGDLIAANDDFVRHEVESGKPTAEVQEHRLVIGVDYSKADPAEAALIASRKTIEGNDGWTILCDENETQKLLLEVEADASSRGYGHGEDDAKINQQRVILVERIREKIADATRYTEGAAAEMADAIRNGEPQALNPDTPIVAWPSNEPATNPNPANARVMRRADAERLGYTQIIHDPDLDAAIRNGEHPPALDGLDNGNNTKHEGVPAGVHQVRIAPDGTGVLPTEPGEDIPVTMNGKEIGRATVREDGTATVSIDGDKAIPTGFARGGYTGIGLSENVVGGIVHQGIFSSQVDQHNLRQARRATEGRPGL